MIRLALFITGFGAFHACSLRNTNPQVEKNGGSTVASISLQGIEEKYYEWLGGKSDDCPKFEKGGCAEALKLISHWHLLAESELGNSNCRDSAQHAPLDSRSANLYVKKGCSYKVKIALGTPSWDTILGKVKANLLGTEEIEVVDQDTIHLTPILHSTSEGIRNGLPESSIEIDPKQTKIEIDPKFE